MSMNINELKKELKHWEDMVPVNNMGKWSRQTKIDSLKKQIESMSEDIGPEYDSAGFTEDDRIINGQYQNINSHYVSNEEADEDYRLSLINLKEKHK